MIISKEAKVGLLVTAGLAILIFGYTFMKGRGIFSKKNIFYAKYQNVDGLAPSNPVEFNGYKIGQVESVKLVSTTKPLIVVKFSVDGDLAFPKNTAAEIFSTDVLGSKSIKMVPKGNLETLAEDGDTLSGLLRPGPIETFTKIIDPVQKKAVNLFANIDSLIEFFNKTMEDDTKENLKGSFASMRQSLENLQKTTKRIDDLFATEDTHIKHTIDNLESITQNIKNYNDDIENIMGNMSNISDSLSSANLAQMISQAEESIKNIHTLLQNLNNGEGTLGKLLKDESVYDNLNKTSENLNELVKDLKENPGRYVRFSVINIGKEKKKEKN